MKSISGDIFVDTFAYFGLNLYAYIVLIVFLIVFFGISVQWRCGMCGKVNTTGMLKFLLFMCDHQGLM